MRKTIKYILPCLLALGHYLLNAQQSKIDSLLNVLKTSKEDTNRVNVLNNLSSEVIEIGAFTRADSFARQAIKLSEKLLRSGSAGRMDSIIKKDIARSLNYIGNISWSQGYYPKALEYYLKALNINEELNDKKGIAVGLGNIGNVYHQQGDYQKMLEYYFKALKIFEELSGKYGISQALDNIGGAYYYLGDYPKALEYYLKALKINEELGAKNLMAHNLSSIGTIYSTQKKYKEGEEYLQKALIFSTEFGDKAGIALNLCNIGVLYGEQKKYKESEDYLQKALKISTEIGILDLKKQCYEELSELYSKQNNWQLAMKYYQHYTEIKDTLLNEDNNKKITQMQTLYESDKKDKEIESLIQKAEIMSLINTKNKSMIYGLAGGILFLLIIAILVIIQHKQKAKRIAVELEQKLLRSQMNPHFIFNSLNAIQSFIYKNEIKESAKYLSGFAKLMRMILENSREEYVSLEKEINTLEYYLTLQKLRFENKFDFTLEVDPEIDSKHIGIPPMFAQPFIENALEHGIKHKELKGKIDVRFKLQNDMIVFEVQDNGVGRKKSSELKEPGKEHRSLATTITQERITALNRKSRKKINLSILDIEHGEISGTKVIFTIPYKELIASQLLVEVA